METQIISETSPLYLHWCAAVDEGRIYDAIKLEQREVFRLSLIDALTGVQDFPLDSPSVRAEHRRVLKGKLYTHSDFFRYKRGQGTAKLPEWWGAAKNEGTREE